MKKAIQGFILARTADGYSSATTEMYHRYLNLMSAHLHNPQVHLIQDADLVEFTAWMRTGYIPRRSNGDTAPLSGRTLEIVWTVMRSFFNWATVDLKLQHRPDANIHKPRYAPTQVHPLSADEVKKLMGVCEKTKAAATNGRASWNYHRKTHERDSALIALLLDTGLRVSEIARLRIRDVDLVSGEVEVRPFGSGQKTKGRHVYMGKVTKKAIWKYLAGRDEPRPDDPLFLAGEKHPMNRTSIRQLLVRLGARAGVKNVHPHRFRHTFAIEYLRNGGDTLTLQRLLGHSTLEMVRHYVELVSSDLQTVHRKASPVDRWF